MAGFGDVILSMMGNEDPRMALLQQQLGASTPGTQQAPGSTSAGAPGAAGTTTPQQPPQQPPQPEVYQSPNELVQLYTDLQNRQRRSGMIDNGIGLIASAFAQPQNRAGIRQALMSGGSTSGAGANDPMKFIGQIMTMQQQREAIADRAKRREGVASIAETHGLDVATAEFLFDNDQLDEVLSALSKPDNQIVQQEDGTHVIVNKTTGNIGQPFGPAKKRDIEIRTDDRGNQFAIYKDTGQRVGDENLVEGQGATNSEREWRLANEERAAKGQPPIAFEDYVHQTGRSRAGSANLGPSGVDFGKPPTDMAWAREKDGSIKVSEDGAPVAVPIVGSKLWQEQQAKDKKETGRESQKSLTGGFIDQSITDALDIIKEGKDNVILPGPTGIGAIAEFFPGDWDARKLSGKLETIKANLGFEKLQQMREQSPTGGALGQVSDFENKLLQSTFGNLDQYGDDAELVRNLFRIQYMADAIVNGVQTEDGVTGINEGNLKESEKAIFARADAAAKEFMGSGGSEEKPEVDPILQKYGVK